MNIGFAGTPLFAAKILSALLDTEHNICCVYTQPDRPCGRGRKLVSSPVKKLALEASLSVYQPKRLQNLTASELSILKQLDLLIVVAYGLILPQEVLTAPLFGCLNVHASLLPKWRGASPIQQAILAGDGQTGISLMKMDSGLDTGPVYKTAACPILITDNSETLTNKLCNLAIPLLIETIPAIETLSPIPQNSQQASYAPKISKKHAHINWQNSAITILRQINGYYTWPTAYSYLNELPIKMLDSRITTVYSKEKCGTILKCCKKEGILIQTNTAALAITRLQLPGKKPMSAKDCLNGNHSFIIGKILN